MADVRFVCLLPVFFFNLSADPAHLSNELMHLTNHAVQRRGHASGKKWCVGHTLVEWSPNPLLLNFRLLLRQHSDANEVENMLPRSGCPVLPVDTLRRLPVVPKQRNTQLTRILRESVSVNALLYPRSLHLSQFYLPTAL